MENEQKEDPVVKRCILTWDIVNFLMALTKGTYVIESPIFSFPDCCWSLTFSAEYIDDDGGLRLGVDLCRRCDENIDSCWNKIKARASITLKTPSEQVIMQGEVRNSFERGNFSDVISHVTTRRNVFEAFRHLPEDTLVIVCDVTAVTGYDNVHRLSATKRTLSSNIRQLLNTPGNSHLITRDGRMLPVYKEILSAHSPVFRAQFMSGVGCLPISYSEDVVRKLLNFIYSGRIGPAIEYDLPSPELYECALEYEILDLQRVLTPENMHVWTEITCRTEIVEIRYPQFARSLAMEQHEANDPLSNICLTLGNISMYENNIRGRLSSTFNHEKGKVCFEIQLQHTMNATVPRAISVSADSYLVDSLGSYKFRMRNLADFNDQGNTNLRFELEVEKLFANENVLFPTDTLQMLCVFKLRLDNGFSSGPDSSHFTTPSAHQRVIFDLDASMGYLLKSQIFADVTLTLSSNERFRVRVHRSVMSARSRYFHDLLQDGTDTIRLEHHMSVKAAKALVLYIYTGNFGIRTFSYDAVISLFMYAHVFAVDGMKADCARTIRLPPLNHRNVFKKYCFASVSEDDDLAKYCQDFILRNMDLLLGTSKWEKFKSAYRNLVEQILPRINENV